MRLDELKESLSYEITVKEVDRHTEELPDGDMMANSIEYVNYTVDINNVNVGELVYDNYFGDLEGDLGNRGVKLEMRGSAEETVKSYLLKTPTGRKHMQLIIKQMGI